MFLLFILTHNAIPHRHSQCETKIPVPSFMEEEGHHHGHHEHDASHHIVNKYLGSIFGFLLEVYFQQGHKQENVYYHKTLKLKTSYDSIISDDYFAIEYTLVL